MQNPDNKLTPLALTEAEKSALPLGYNQIYVKAISPKEAEIAVTVYSKKYKKADLLPLTSEKPISKIMPWREES
jgi:hypothetical protein